VGCAIDLGRVGGPGNRRKVTLFFSPFLVRSGETSIGRSSSCCFEIARLLILGGLQICVLLSKPTSLLNASQKVYTFTKPPKSIVGPFLLVVFLAFLLVAAESL
jgi:hypothetical protein